MKTEPEAGSNRGRGTRALAAGARGLLVSGDPLKDDRIWSSKEREHGRVNLVLMFLGGVFLDAYTGVDVVKVMIIEWVIVGWI